MVVAAVNCAAARDERACVGTEGTSYRSEVMELTAEECRVLGVLIEKAMTTPDQYPLSLNALVNGCNQKSNRHPVVAYDEDLVLRAVDGLRRHHLVGELSGATARVLKYRHRSEETLQWRPIERAIMAELLSRGPQTLGELRGRASRMQAMESLEVVQHVLDALKQREPAQVKRIPPAPGSRAQRWVSLIGPEPAGGYETAASTSASGDVGGSAGGSSADTTGEVNALREEVALLNERVDELMTKHEELLAYVRRLAESLGEPAPEL